GPSLFDDVLPGLQLVPVGPEPERGGDRLTGTVLEIAQGDDVPLAVREVLRRPDDQVDLGRVPRVRVRATGTLARRVNRGRVRVELGPDRLADTRLGIDHDHGLRRVGVP